MSRGRDIEGPEKPNNDKPDNEEPGKVPAHEDSLDNARSRAGDQESIRKPSGLGREASRQKRTRLRETHEPVRMRDTTYVFAARDLETLQDIGKFRTVSESDLEHFRFEGDRVKAAYDLRRLMEQGLIRRQIVSSRRGERLRVIAVNRSGKRILDRNQRHGAGAKQRYYSDLKKPAEIFHDTAIYRMYQAETERIRSSGGKILRVILDYELKKKLYSPLAKARAVGPEDYARRQEEIASENGLKVIDGKIPLPDLRIEYETREGDIDKVDLELATEHYKEHQLAEKKRAGFHIYFGGSDRSAGSVVRDERELTAGILSL